jgi:heme-degrading monooxygenase HmoA
MIVRTWHGCVPLKHAEGFAKHLEKTGVEYSRSIRGNRGALVHRETQGSWEHFFLATYWHDLDAVKAFAGEHYNVAVTYPDDEVFELLSDPYVFQHEVEAVSPL